MVKGNCRTDLVSRISSGIAQALGNAASGIAVLLPQGTGAQAKARLFQSDPESCGHHSADRDCSRQFDTLTRLPNRRVFFDHVNKVFSSAGDTPSFGLIVLKLSRLKHINAHFGYSCGDMMLAHVSNELATYVRKLDQRNYIARTGDAEFSFLVHNVADDCDLKVLGHILLTIANVPQIHQNFYARLDGNVGVAVANGECLSARELVLRADLAMQEARKNGSNEAAVYTPSLKSGPNRNRKIESEIQLAIKSREIYAVYQPQFDILSGQMVGMEALARWKHPELGMIPPTEFIDVAERAGSIVPLGQHILRLACEDAVAMRGAPCVSVNLSVLQIVQDDLPEFIKHVLNATGLEPSRLKLEVTESAIIKDSKRIFDTLASLKALGVSISLDDFGTGYSALSYLTDFDWDELKIDRSFVAKALKCDKARHVAQTIGGIAEKMKARLTVEGIETSAQRDLFASIGYQVAQGFFYAKPMAYADLNLSPYVLNNQQHALADFH
ncbi:bifunctional diguanylate cyclase/phosphodiesterase [Labrenzia sp. OB1]|uniref:putative bifunctional diguanylate cyclase/phosphodiesterase n=1 Tax=Labrenzia sp. OB1 TaxID=1561204 RepID=UPI0007B2DCF2|nr:bifunctional diguanylate cyclase/phosphodiesterase [Labrenzia sp. OB1]KZM51376.1 hypothetical protein OA90_02400 [Labrenzia sp. OB1]